RLIMQSYKTFGPIAKLPNRPYCQNTDSAYSLLEVKMKYDSDYSGWGNEVLYRICKEKPLHDNIDVISSKLWLIGRAYSAAIERKAGPDFKIENAAKIIKESRIDIHINNLNQINRINEKNIHVLLEAHKYFTDKLKEATGVAKRSLASKYLHFHAPNAVFIFDSIANNRITRIVSIDKIRTKLQRKFDDPYELFSYRCLYYRNNILEKTLGLLATPRRIDMELLGHRPLTT
ncbi:MAG: hypothetical protein D6732_24655, partial [Methanobacteriota archaeon]